MTLWSDEMMEVMSATHEQPQHKPSESTTVLSINSLLYAISHELCGQQGKPERIPTSVLVSMAERTLITRLRPLREISDFE